MKKDIAFVIYYPYQWYVYKNIYAHLKDRSFFIIDLCVFDEGDGIDTLGKMVKLLEENNVEYKILRKEEYGLSNYVESFFKDIKVMVSVWEKGCILLPKTSDILKVCITYGAGKELTMVRSDRGLYDLILSYGERDTKLFSLSTTTIPIGNPKFDDYYNNDLDFSFVDSLNLKEDKKTVFYLPTHSDLGSLKDVLPELLKLKSLYNIIVKLHYYLEREESDFLSSLDTTGIYLLYDDVDILPLLKICDIAISDNSSVIFDVMQADKPLLVEDIWTKDFFEVSHQKGGFAKRGRTYPLTYPDSIEQEIKRKGLVAINKDVKKIKEDIEHALSNDSVYQKNRKKILKEIMSYTDGSSAKRGADLVLDLINNKLEIKKGILYYSYKRERMFRVPTKSDRESNLAQKPEDLEGFSGKHGFIIFNNKNEDVILTIRSLFELGIKPENIMVITRDVLNIQDYDLSLYKNNLSLIKISTGLTDAYEFAAGTLILALNSGVIVDREGFEFCAHNKLLREGESKFVVAILKVRKKYSELQNFFMNVKVPVLKYLYLSKVDTLYDFVGLLPSETGAALISGDFLKEITNGLKKEIKSYESLIDNISIFYRREVKKVLILNIFRSHLQVKENEEEYLKNNISGFMLVSLKSVISYCFFSTVFKLSTSQKSKFLFNMKMCYVILLMKNKHFFLRKKKELELLNNTFSK